MISSDEFVMQLIYVGFIISLTDLKPAITTWFFPQIQNNQLLAMSLRDHTQNARTCMLQTPKKLDDGWSESVEEQSLLLLVWRHYITRQYIKDVL